MPPAVWPRQLWAALTTTPSRGWWGTTFPHGVQRLRTIPPSSRGTAVTDRGAWKMGPRTNSQFAPWLRTTTSAHRAEAGQASGPDGDVALSRDRDESRERSACDPRPSTTYPVQPPRVRGEHAHATRSMGCRVGGTLESQSRPLGPVAGTETGICLLQRIPNKSLVH